MFKDVHDNSFFPHAARLWNSLLAECFSLAYDLNSFKPKLKVTFNLYVISKQLFLFASNICVLLFLVTPCLVLALQPCIDSMTIKKARYYYPSMRIAGQPEVRHGFWSVGFMLLSSIKQVILI